MKPRPLLDVSVCGLTGRSLSRPGMAHKAADQKVWIRLTGSWSWRVRISGELTLWNGSQLSHAVRN